ncbi:DUF4124 domain-containing protein [Thiohalocapsa halophila]
MRAPRAMLLLALLAPLAQAQVYQSMGPDGRPVFTDRPSPNARALDIPLPADGPAEATPQAARSKDAGFLGPYDMLEIVAPADEHRIRDAEGELAVSLVISPALMEGHRLVVEVDGVPAEGDLPSPSQVLLRGLALGTHRIRAVVQDAAAAVVGSTPPIQVHVLPPLPEAAKP